MIALESFRRFHLRDVAAILAAAALFALAEAGMAFLDARIAYYGALLLFGMLLTFTSLLVRKAGTAVLLALCAALFSFTNGVESSTGWTKVLVFLISGLLFELVFLMLKVEIRLIPLDVLFGSAVAVASIPLTTMLLLSMDIALRNGTALANVALLGLFLGIMAAVLAFLLWYNVQRTRLVLWFEYGI